MCKPVNTVALKIKIYQIYFTIQTHLHCGGWSTLNIRTLQYKSCIQNVIQVKVQKIKILLLVNTEFLMSHWWILIFCVIIYYVLAVNWLALFQLHANQQLFIESPDLVSSIGLQVCKHLTPADVLLPPASTKSDWLISLEILCYCDICHFEKAENQETEIHLVIYKKSLWLWRHLTILLSVSRMMDIEDQTSLVGTGLVSRWVTLITLTLK